MIKYFCDECGEELSAEEASFSIDMTGKLLCCRHVAIYLTHDKVYVLEKEKFNEEKRA
jgi:hypothetical protein